ncbi:MAG: DUF3604 domain-containing protein [Myxococcota bacterium]
MLLGALGLVGALAGCEAEAPELRNFALARAGTVDPREPCAERTPLRRALWGDLHVHTTLSSDAWNYGLEVRPADSYGYAFGEPIRLPPNDASGRGTREVRIDRPLDFAAVTDHSEFLGELALCRDPGSEVYDGEGCVALRASTVPADNPHALTIMTPWPKREAEVCGEDGARCDRAMLGAWQEILAAAERWNDRTAACARTTFIGWEYTDHRLGSNLHRNVIFKTNLVPSRPISYLDAPREWKLWEMLRSVCLEGEPGCDVIAIPHNSNISNGRMFSIDYADANGRAAERERAKLRARMEPVVEVMQHKGDSECRPEMAGVIGSADELCAFEKFEQATWKDGEEPGACGELFDDWRIRLGPSCLSRRSYVRYVLTEGLAEERRIGVNPFKLGLIGSTDTHNGLAGGVAEKSWPGHLGIADADPKRMLSEEPGLMGNMANGPGGLAGVYAEENSREAIFEALRRREVFGTSGPRIEPRFFAAAELPEDLCDRPDRLEVADAAGVPMGGDLVLGRGDVGPVFAAFATADPGTEAAPGGDLQRIQIIKGWVDDEGALHEEVVDVAGGPNDASVDPATCAPTGTGARELCGVWRDPAFDAELAAVYYARVVENPSCRYSAWRCSALPEAERPAGCRHERMSPVQQERAWTSPIWVRRGSDDEPERAPRASKRKKNRAKRKPPSEEGGPS